jgi:PKD repeat protein
MKLLAALIISICFLLAGCGKTPEANFTWSPQNPKAGEEVQFTNLSSDAKKYSWNLGDMNVSSETNPKHTYKSSGNYIVDLSASNGLKSDMKTETITVLP